jgi:hypothetical protein
MIFYNIDPHFKSNNWPKKTKFIRLCIGPKNQRFYDDPNGVVPVMSWGLNFATLLLTLMILRVYVGRMVFGCVNQNHRIFHDLSIDIPLTIPEISHDIHTSLARKAWL